MPQTFWYFATKHAAKMMNVIPGKYKGKLASPFMLVHGVHPDQWAWLPIFSLCYFHHEKDSNASRSRNQAQTLDRIIIGWSPTSTAILVNNPRNQKYYELGSYHLDPQSPISGLPNNKIWWRVICLSPLRLGGIFSKPFPQGIRVADVHPTTGKTCSGMVIDIPFGPNSSPHYLVLYNDDTSLSIPAASLPALIPKPMVDILDTFHLLPPFLQVGFKITFEKGSQYHKGYLSNLSNGTY